MAREMKYSGVKWIGDFPENWQTKKLKYVADTVSETGLNGVKIGLENIESKTGKFVHTDTDYNGVGQIVHKDDIVYGKLRPYLCKAWKAEFECNAVGDFYVFRCNHLSDSAFIQKVLVSDKFNEVCTAATYGTKMPRVSLDYINSVLLPIPPLPEQQVIADFLDAKCAEIDGVLADLDAEVKTLADYKKSIIAETVTRGLNPNIPMKKSGIPWAESIPEHWKIKKGKYTLQLLQRPVKDDDGVITCFRDGEVTLRSNRREDGFTMSAKEYGYQGIEPGDLVVHGMDGFAGAIGISDSRGKGTPVLNVLDSDYNKKYLMYYLRNLAYGDVFLALSTGIRVRSCDLGWKKLGEIRIVLPPLEEQEAIANYLDEKCSALDQYILDKKKLIETLKSYKSSLIYEYVTGKKQVPYE